MYMYIMYIRIYIYIHVCVCIYIYYRVYTCTFVTFFPANFQAFWPGCEAQRRWTSGTAACALGGRAVTVPCRRWSWELNLWHSIHSISVEAVMLN